MPRNPNLPYSNFWFWPLKCEHNRQLGLLRPHLITEKKGTHMRKQKGFSLIELLIVVAIILIIAAIAIPNLLRARISANESSAASSIRTINTAEVSFYSTYPATGYSAPGAAALTALGPGAITGCPAGGPLVTAACLIDWNLSQAATVATAKSGFYFGHYQYLRCSAFLELHRRRCACCVQPEWCALLLLQRRWRDPLQPVARRGWYPDRGLGDLRQRSVASVAVV